MSASADDNAGYSPASRHSVCATWQLRKCSSPLVLAAWTFLTREEKEDLRCRSMGEDSGKWPSHLQNSPRTTQISDTLQCSQGLWVSGQLRELLCVSGTVRSPQQKLHLPQLLPSRSDIPEGSAEATGLILGASGLR